MANESFSISELIPARPDQIYAAWMNSEEHSAITGDAASVDAVIGGEHSSFSGYARGTNVELLEGRRIVQTWRTPEFPAGSPDSRLEVTLEETVGGTMLTILHTDIPTGQGNTYRQGWEKYYLEPLKRYFNGETTTLEEEEEEPTQVEVRREVAVPVLVLPPPVPAARKPANKPAKKAAKKAAKPAKVRAKAAKSSKRAGAKKPKAAAKVRARTKTKPRAKLKAKTAAKAKARKPGKTKAAAKRPAKKRRKGR